MLQENEINALLLRVCRLIGWNYNQVRGYFSIREEGKDLYIFTRDGLIRETWYKAFGDALSELEYSPHSQEVYCMIFKKIDTLAARND